jgi:hypothetical protein
MPATIAYENVLRRAMIEGWAKASPEVRAAMKTSGGDVNAALAKVARSHPQVIQNISKRTFDALGDYSHYNKLEKGVKAILPFYGWDRHIVRSVARLVSEHPARLNALLQVGAQGHADQQQALGDLPSYAQGDVRLPGLPWWMGPLNGRTPVLQTRQWNPFTTFSDLLNIPKALTGQAGGPATEILSSGIGPVIQAIIEQATGRSTLSGAPIKGNAFVHDAGSIPPVGLLEQLLGHGAATKPTSLYQHDLATTLAGFLGVPVKKVAMNTAHLYAKQEQSGKPK